MRCCTFYSPTAFDMDRHDGLQISDKYPFDKLLQHPSCTNEDVVGKNAFGGCPFAKNQEQCHFYTPEEPRVLRALNVQREGHEDMTIQVETARVTFGIVEFYITVSEGDTKEVLHTVNAHRHGNDSFAIVSDLVDKKLEELGENKTVEELEIENNDEENSYLLEVSNEVRTGV